MLGRSGRIVIVAVIVAATLLATTASAAAIKLGSGLRDPADAGLCTTSPPALEAICTEAQLQLTPERDAGGGLLADHHGVVTDWQVVSGPATAGTAGVRLRLRLIHGGRPVGGPATPYIPLPLTESGIHRFPIRLPVEPDDELALDLSVLGSALEAGSAPIAHAEPGIGEVGEWAPALAGAAQPITDYLQGTELLLAARVEPDADRDGYGDRTQDDCAYDPRRQAACLPDHMAPQSKVAYAHRQDFPDSGRISLSVEPSEYSQVIANAQLQTPTTTWGIHGDRAWVRNGSTNLFLDLPPRPQRAAQATLAHGGKVYVKCFLTVIDASGNRSHRTIRIRPKES